VQVRDADGVETAAIAEVVDLAGKRVSGSARST
jgi:hypothetical protein